MTRVCSFAAYYFATEQSFDGDKVVALLKEVDRRERFDRLKLRRKLPMLYSVALKYLRLAKKTPNELFFSILSAKSEKQQHARELRAFF